MAKDTFSPLVEEEREGRQPMLKDLLFKYIRYWYWFLLGIALALIVALIYNSYAQVIYNSHAEIQIIKEKGNGLDLSGMEGAGSLFNARDVNLENEIVILKSRRLLDTVVDKLDLTTFFLLREDLEQKKFGEMHSLLRCLGLTWLTHRRHRQTFK